MTESGETRLLQRRDEPDPFRPVWEPEIWEPEITVSKQNLETKVTADCVHLLLDFNPKVGIFDMVNHIKGYASHELRKEFPSLHTRLPTLWTRSKFISSVGAVTLEVVKKYIEEQYKV